MRARSIVAGGGSSGPAGTAAGIITGKAPIVGQAGTFTVVLGNGVAQGYAVLYRDGADVGSRVSTTGGTVSLTPGNSGSYKARLYSSASGGICLWETPSWTTVALPAQVAGLTVGAITPTSVALSWAAVSGATDYVVEHRLSPSGTWTVFGDGISTSTTATVTGLTAGTAYDFRVSATNAAGTGPASAMASATTTAAQGGGKGTPSAIAQVTGLSVYSSTPESVTLAWAKPAGMFVTPAGDTTYTGNFQRSDYQVEYRLAGSSAWTEWVKSPIASHEDSLFEALVGFVPGLTYEFRVTGRKVTVYRPNINTAAVLVSVDDEGPPSAILTYTMPLVPAAPPAATFLATAQRIKAAQQTISIVEDDASAVPTLTALDTLDAANPATLSPINGRSSPRVAVASMPTGPTGRIGRGWVLGNRRTGALASSQGGSLRFSYSGQKFDFTASTSSGLVFRVRYSEDGGLTYRWVKDTVRLTAGTGTHYIVCDFGSAKSRIVEVHGAPGAIIGGFNFDVTPGDATVPAAAPLPADAPKASMWFDSYVYGQGDGVDFSSCFAANTAKNLGIVALYNHGFQTNAWGRRSGAADHHPWAPERMSNPRIAASYPGATGEVDAFGALDIVFLCATINDNASIPQRLYDAAKATFRYARLRQPNALIVFTLTMFNPESVPSDAVLNAYRTAFVDTLGTDPGAIMLETVDTAATTPNTVVPAAPWSSTTRPTPYFPATGDTVHPSPAAGPHYGSLIAAGTMHLVNRVIAAAGGDTGSTPAAASILREDGSYLLREDGSRIIRE